MSWENGCGRAFEACYYASLDLGLRGGGRKLEVEEAAWLGDVEGGEDLGLTSSGGRALGHPSLGRLHGDQVHAVELVTDVAPGVAGAVLDDPHEKQPEPTELDAAPATAWLARV